MVRAWALRGGSVGALKWAVAGVLPHWGPGGSKNRLDRVRVKHVTAPEHAKGKWTCVAKPSETGEGPFAFQVGEQVIAITKWTCCKPVASERWRAHGSKWFTVDGKEEETEVMEVDSQEAQAIALDSPTAATQDEPNNGKNSSPSKHTTKRAISLSPLRSPLLLLRRRLQTQGPREARRGPIEAQRWNLSGHGDCGYLSSLPPLRKAKPTLSSLHCLVETAS